MTVEQIRNMTAEEFKEATLDERIEALAEEIESYNFQKDWCEKHQWMDKRNSEYRLHKKFMMDHRNTLCSWLNSIGVETLPYRE